MGKVAGSAARRGAAFLPAALAFLWIIALSSCGGKLPQVAAVEWRLESRPGASGTRYESLSAFASIKDDDGVDNVDQVWVVNDGSALAWKLTGEDWTRTQDGSDTWIGGASLAMADLGPIPRGRYRFVAVDAAGQVAELGFDVAGDPQARGAPEISFSPATGELRAGSGWAETLILGFDAAGVLLRSVPARSGASSLAEAFGQDIAGQIALVAAYGYDPGLKSGSFSERIKTR